MAKQGLSTTRTWEETALITASGFILPALFPAINNKIAGKQFDDTANKLDNMDTHYSNSQYVGGGIYKEGSVGAGATQPINRWALLDEYFKWYQSGLIDDIAMLEHTDIRNKKSILQRKSLYSQLQQQLEGLTETLKDREGTIETLQRQVIQSEIQNKIDEGSRQVDSQITKTIAQQKLLQQRMDSLRHS